MLSSVRMMSAFIPKADIDRGALDFPLSATSGHRDALDKIRAATYALPLNAATWTTAF